MEAWTIHGGRLAAAQAAYGGVRHDWLDLSTGINPHPWPGTDSIALDWRRLPEPSALAALEAAAAAHFGVDQGHLCAVPGSEIGLRLLGRLLPGEKAAHLAPGYRTHAEAFVRSTAMGVDGLANAARHGGTILLANPNNPDGRRLPVETLLAIAGDAAAGGGQLIVDEAFADTCDDGSLAPHVGGALPLVVLRSFGKFFGLAGVRLGFVVGSEAIVAACRAALGDWPVSAAAIAIGAAAYRDALWIAATRARLAHEAAALDAVLARHDLVARGACPLFRLIETDDAATLFDRLAHRHILTRPFADQPRWLRVGLPEGGGGLSRLDAALGDG